MTLPSDPPPGFDLVTFANDLVLKTPPLPVLDSPNDTPLFLRLLDDALGRALERHELFLPNLHEHVESLAVFSDYGGEQGRFRTYSFLIVGWDALHFCFEQFLRLRDRHGLNEPYKEIAYKTMAYGPQRRALDDILSAAELAPGLLFTLAVANDVQSILAENCKASVTEFVRLLELEGLGVWKPNVAERLLRVVHTISYLLALLTRQGHKVVWMTDHDAIAANEEKTEALGKLLGRIMRFYSKVEYGTIGYAKPFAGEAGKHDLTDLLSLTDLSAGCVAEYLTAAEDANPQIKTDTNKVMLWLARQGIGLKKLTFVVRNHPSGQIEGALTTFVPKEEPLIPVTTIPIVFQR